MDSVHILWYVLERDGNDEEFFIGAYTSENEAQAATGRLKDKKGFADDPKGFQIHSYKLNHDHWTDGFVFVEE